jgi:hypothetical protein
MKLLSNLIMILAILTFYSCDMPTHNFHADSTQTDSPDSVAANNTTAASDYTKALIGTWDYETTENEIGGTKVNIKAMYKWTMTFTQDGFCEEMSMLSESGEKMTAKKEFTVSADTIYRKGLLTVTIDKLNDKELVLNSMGAKMFFKKVE